MVYILAGIGIGLVVLLSEAGNEGNARLLFREYFAFKEELFFFVLLPPIILDAGYNMGRKKNFFANATAIVIFAFIGCFISTAVLGASLHLLNVRVFDGELGFNGPTEAFKFGSVRHYNLHYGDATPLFAGAAALYSVCGCASCRCCPPLIQSPHSRYDAPLSAIRQYLSQRLSAAAMLGFVVAIISAGSTCSAHSSRSSGWLTCAAAAAATLHRCSRRSAPSRTRTYSI